MAYLDVTTPVLLMGGYENALAITRNLGKRGIDVRIGGEFDHIAMMSRYCKEKFIIAKDTTSHDFWENLLLDKTNNYLHGHILFACDDFAIEFLAYNREALEKVYIVDDAVPKLQLSMLDKQATLELAKSVDVPVPNYWEVHSIDDVENLRGKVNFPAMVKPIHSHKFQSVFDRKLFIIKNYFEELIEKSKLAIENGLEIMIVEMIPGPDILSHSYFTYIDKNNVHLYEHTKRTPRRYPINRGGGCYHKTEWMLETAELGRKFFDELHFHGIANIEFKRDQRDGQLKVIEVNARFTANHELFVRCGMPIDLIIYCYLTKQEIPKFDLYQQDRRLWYPIRDYLCFCELHRLGKMTFLDWLKNLGFHKQAFPIFSIYDPWPFIVSTFVIVRNRIKRILDERSQN